AWQRGWPSAGGHLLGKGAPKSENPNITYILCTMFGAMLPTISAEEPTFKAYKDRITSVEIKPGVTRIANSAFYECSGIRSVVIPSSVTSIGSAAFSGCSGITSLTIPDGVTRIEDSAFNECSGITSLTIPSSVTRIGSRAFSGCSGITSLTIPSSVVSIEDGVFEYCSRVTSLTIPEGITSIGYGTFAGCSSITSIAFPSSLTSIGSYAFSGCSGITSLTIPGNVTSIGRSAFSRCSGITSLSIPGSVTSIEERAFEYCSSIMSLTIPEGITSIGPYAFRECSSLTSITLPSSLTSIESYAFVRCSSLTRLTFLEGITNIGQGAFEECSSLTSVTIPGSVTNIDYWAFRDCSSLTRVTLLEGVTSIGSQAFDGCSSITNLTIPDSVTNIGGTFSDCSGLKTAGPIGGGYDYEFGWKEMIPDYAFFNCSEITHIVIPSSVTSVGKSTFSGCSGLKTAGPIGGGYDYEFGWKERIPDYAFAGCSGLKNAVIPEGITSIGADAFKDCSNVTSLTIPGSVTNIGYWAFSGCKGLKTAGPTGEGYGYEFGWTENIPDNAFQGCSTLTSVTIPESVTSIGNNAFSHCYDIMSISIPGRVTSIGDEAFLWCIYLKSITIPASVKSIGEGAFARCNSLNNITFLGSPPAIASDTTFENVTANAYYPTRMGWTESDCQDYGGDLTWIPVENNPKFNDVTDREAYYYVPVYWAVDRGITSGTSSTTFSPSKTCTRGQIVTFLWKAMGSPEPYRLNNPFTDVSSDDYFFKPVLWARLNGITSGTSSATFSPGNPCTRGQIVTFLWRAMGSPEPKWSYNPFTDVSSDDYFFKAVLWARENDITSGTSAKTFSPGKACTRAQAMTFLYKAMN
ncbi:MAG: leucine-rich repeat protein, partial [Oscillospiraceae bacterium]|nr:leucine-rich repeat protein [Oscillospiraceae bacterium]